MTKARLGGGPATTSTSDQSIVAVPAVIPPYPTGGDPQRRLGRRAYLARRWARRELDDLPVAGACCPCCAGGESSPPDGVDWHGIGMDLGVPERQLAGAR
jgi:hypothetical protein